MLSEIRLIECGRMEKTILEIIGVPVLIVICFDGDGFSFSLLLKVQD